MNIIEVKHKNRILAIIFKHSLKSGGVRFLTPNEYTLQLGLLEHPAGTIVRDHAHNHKIHYNVDTTQEFIYLESGRVLVKIFTDNFELVKKVKLSPGDFILHIAGGHGFEILEKCRMIEVKQGPYPGDKLAKIFKNST